MSVTVSEQLPLLAAAPNGIKKLRELILELAVRGKLVAQDASDDPASELLKRIAIERKRKGFDKSSARADEEPQFDVPAGWEWVRFGEIAQHNAGKTLDRGRSHGVLRDYITTSNLYWGYFALENVRQMAIRDEEVERCTARKDDLLICEGGEAGRAAVWEEDREICFQNHIHRARFYGCISPRYAYRVLERLNATGEINRFRKGVAISNMSGKALASIPFPLPPLAEQRRIAAKIDELMALCDRLEAQQADAESAHAQLVANLLDSLTRASDSDDFVASWQRLSAYFHTLFTTESSIDALTQTILQLAVMGKLVPQDPSDEPANELVERIKAKKLNLLKEAGSRKRKVLSDVFGEPPYEIPSSWEWQTVDSVLHVTGGVTLGRKLTGRKMLSKPYLRVANVQRGHLDLHQIKEIEVPEDEVEKYRLRNGDLLITEGGDWDKVGRTAIWRDELPECLHQNHVFRARAVTMEWDPRWAEMYLNAAPAKEYFAGSSKQTTNLASINMTQLRACAFPVPPLAEQHRIVDKFGQLMFLCEKLRVAIQQRNQHSCHLADALVDKALSSAPDAGTNVVDLSCYLVSRLATKPTFGRTAHMKLIYLADTHLGLKLRGNYVREAAGPLDKSLYRVEEQAEANGWYTHTSAPLKSSKEKVTYHTKSALAAKARKFAEDLGGKRRELDRLISVLGDRNTEELEIVATLFAAWNDALLDGQSPDDDWVIREVRENWHIEKQRFSPDQLRYWLNWMRGKRLVPSGTGRHTQHQTRLL
jgi:type I restriction enzyme S subunit